MRFSVWPSPAQPWEEILDVATHAEATGWDGVWFADHFMPNAADVSGPTNECWTVLAGLAATVPRVRLGAMVSGNTYRHPAVLAKMATTVDIISGGRVVLGLGAGWQENEHRAYGLEFSDIPGRLSMLDEACQVVKGLINESRTTFEGKHYTLRDAPLEPKPAGSLPLLVGGGGEKVTMRIAATYADEWNVWGTPEVLAQKGAVLDRHLERAGRERAAVQRSAQALTFLSEDAAFLDKVRSGDSPMPRMIGTPAQMVETVAAYREAGVDELIIPLFTFGPIDRAKATLDLFITEVAPAFRS